MATVTRRWTITSWNLHGSATPPLDRVADVLARTGADVVALQEVRASQAAAIAERLGVRHAWALKHYPHTPLVRSHAEGLAILTPHDLSGTGSASLTPGTSRWTYRHRIAQWGLVQRADHSGYRVMNLHLSPHDASDRRAKEVALAVELAGAGGAPLVICGDLNDDGEPGVVEELPAFEPVEPPPTNPADAPVRRLDHVLVPDGASNVTVDVPAGGADWAALSDHLPVTVAFDLDWVEGDFAPGAR